METWTYIDSGMQEPSYNMALDEKLMDWHRAGDIPPTIRFYEWEPATLSIGYFQRVDRDIDLEAVAAHKAGFVRRPTGGRAVLHDDEVTYSVIVREDHPLMPQSVTEAYRVISQGLLEGFREMGLEAEFSIPKTEEEKSDLRNPRSAVCFDAPSWYEMVVNNRKIAGSAQTRQRGIILQHGSIIRTLKENELFDMFKFPNQRVRERMQKGFKTKATPINELISPMPSLEEMKNIFKAGFERALQVKLEPLLLTETQKKQVKELADNKYKQDSWNFKF